MVSLDDTESNRAFAESVGAAFPVLSDPTRKAAQAYGVVSAGGRYPKRWTFYIDQSGIIRSIDKGVNPSSHGEDMVEQLKALGFPQR